MLCYVTRPDAVLMEVEVEAKANGEDCLNQVRATMGKGIPAGPRGAPGPRRCCSGARRRCSSGRGALPGRQAPASSSSSSRAWGWGDVEDACGGGAGSRGPGHCREPPPCLLAGHFSKEKVAPRTCRRCVRDAARGVLAEPGSATRVPGGGGCKQPRAPGFPC